MLILYGLFSLVLATFLRVYIVFPPHRPSFRFLSISSPSMCHRYGPAVVSSKGATRTCPVISFGCLVTEHTEEMFFETST